MILNLWIIGLCWKPTAATECRGLWTVCGSCTIDWEHRYRQCHWQDSWKKKHRYEWRVVLKCLISFLTILLSGIFHHSKWEGGGWQDGIFITRRGCNAACKVVKGHSHQGCLGTPPPTHPPPHPPNPPHPQPPPVQAKNTDKWVWEPIKVKKHLHTRI